MASVQIATLPIRSSDRFAFGSLIGENSAIYGIKYTTGSTVDHPQRSFRVPPCRFTAHSSSSGHTPPILSPLFGPLLFSLGLAALPFHHTYLQYLPVTHTTEHVLFTFVRWQDAPSNEHPVHLTADLVVLRC